MHHWLPFVDQDKLDIHVKQVDQVIHWLGSFQNGTQFCFPWLAFLKAC